MHVKIQAGTKPDSAVEIYIRTLSSGNAEGEFNDHY
jgi:hypothetical protein